MKKIMTTKIFEIYYLDLILGNLLNFIKIGNIILLGFVFLNYDSILIFLS